MHLAAINILKGLAYSQLEVPPSPVSSKTSAPSFWREGSSILRRFTGRWTEDSQTGFSHRT